MVCSEERQALEYLSRNMMHNIGMIRPIERGTAQILYSGKDGVMLRDSVSGAVMQSVSDYETGARLLARAPKAKLYLIHQGFMLDDFRVAVCPNSVFENLTAVYIGSELMPVRTDMSIEPMDISDLETIGRHYGFSIVDEDYIIGRLKAGALYGAYVDGELVGFGGEHEEGSLGMLVILENHRRKGYAASLVGFGINRQLELNLTPFSNIGVENHASIEMHKKLGFTISSDSVWWLF